MATKIFLLIITCCLLPCLSNAQNSSFESAQLLNQAEGLIKADSASDAIEFLKPFIKNKNPEISIRAFRLIGMAYLSEREIAKAEEFLHEAVKLSRLIFNRHEEAQSLFLLARAKAQANSFSEAKSFAHKARSIIRKTGDKELELQVQNFLMWMYFETDESFYSILDEETQTFRLVNDVGSELQKALVYNNLGYDLTVAGTVPIDSTIKLMEFANSTYIKHEGTEGRWYTLMNLTWQHRLKNDLETSKMYGEKSLTRALIIEDRHAIVEAAFQLGETLIELGKINEASAYYETGLKWRSNGNDRDRYVFDVYYGRYLWETGEKEQAISILETAVGFLIESEVFYEMHGRALLAEYYSALGKTENAQAQLMLLDDAADEYVSLETKCIAALTRAKILSQNDEPEIALKILTSWADYTKSMNMHQLYNKIATARENYL